MSLIERLEAAEVGDDDKIVFTDPTISFGPPKAPKWVKRAEFEARFPSDNGETK